MERDRQAESQVLHFGLARAERLANQFYARHGLFGEILVYLERVVLLVDRLEDGYLVRVPERDRLGHVDRKRLVALLQATIRKVPQRVDVLSEIESDLLSLSERERRHVGQVLGLVHDSLERALAAQRVHQELAVEREAHGLVLQIDHDADHVGHLTLLAERVAALVPLARRVALERVRVRTVRDVGVWFGGERRPADLHRTARQQLALVVPLARAYRVRLLGSIRARYELRLEFLFRFLIKFNFKFLHKNNR